MSVNIAPGKIAVPVANGGTALCVSDAVEAVTLAPAPGSGLNRWDLVICQVRGNDIDGGANNDFVFTNVTGTAIGGGADVAPPVPANAQTIASVHIAGGSASINSANLFDGRPAGLDTVKSGQATTSVLASDVALTANTGTVPLTIAVVAGRQYLIGFVATFFNTSAVAAVSGWLQDSNSFPVATSGTTNPTVAWGQVSGSGIYTPTAGNSSIGLNVSSAQAGTTLKAANAAGATHATLLWLVPI
jgi:hypothetical protein